MTLVVRFNVVCTGNIETILLFLGVIKMFPFRWYRVLFSLCDHVIARVKLIIEDVLI